MLSLALFLPVIGYALRCSKIEQYDSEEFLIWAALTSFVFSIMALSTYLPEGLNLGYSGAAFLVLTLGYARALVSMTLLLGIMYAFNELGILLWFKAALPVALTWLVMKLSRRYLPANPFVFLLGCGFIGLFLVYAGTEVLTAWILSFTSLADPISFLSSDGLIWQVLLAGGEATLEGMVITLLVAFYPKAVALFDDQFYLSRPM